MENMIIVGQHSGAVGSITASSRVHSLILNLDYCARSHHVCMGFLKVLWHPIKNKPVERFPTTPKTLIHVHWAQAGTNSKQIFTLH